MGKKSSIHSHFCLFVTNKAVFPTNEMWMSKQHAGSDLEVAGYRDEAQHYVRRVLSPPELRVPPRLAEQHASSSSSFPVR